MAHGRRQFVPLAIMTCALAVARTFCDVIVRMRAEPRRQTRAIDVHADAALRRRHDIGRARERRRGRRGQPPHEVGARDPRSPTSTVGPDPLGGLSKSSYARASAPAIAPASAAFCAWFRLTHNTPKSTTNVAMLNQINRIRTVLMRMAPRSEAGRVLLTSSPSRSCSRFSPARPRFRHRPRRLRAQAPAPAGSAAAASAAAGPRRDRAAAPGAA